MSDHDLPRLSNSSSHTTSEAVSIHSSAGISHSAHSIAERYATVASAVPVLNVANILTILRVCAVPLCLYAYYVGHYQHVYYQLWICWTVFCLATVTDRLDGYYARKHQIYTDFGAFLDPLADKLLVCAVSFALSIGHEVPWWFTIVVFCREVIVTAARINKAADRGVLPAHTVGKWKTTLQTFTLSLFLFPIINRVPQWHIIGLTALIITAAITVYSALFYIKMWFINNDPPHHAHASMHSSNLASVSDTHNL